MATDIVTRELKKPVYLVEYLYRRLHEVGIRSVHGVPGEFCFQGGLNPTAINSWGIGDYNLHALDYLPKCGLSWVGNCNELNAGKN